MSNLVACFTCEANMTLEWIYWLLIFLGASSLLVLLILCWKDLGPR